MLYFIHFSLLLLQKMPMLQFQLLKLKTESDKERRDFPL